ncbi:MAG: toprim domain-containing protein [Candidatus Methanofastidiosum sp.]|nr:toprim domain-containing protein [Methanofastidiosum sp.]
MSLKEDLENTIVILNKLREEEGVILVEGQNDIQSLVNLGIKNKIIAVSQHNIFDVIDNIPEKEIIVLTDFDKKGTYLFKRYVKELQSSGKKVITIYYHELKKYLKKYITGIEQIYPFLKRRGVIEENEGLIC